MEILEGDALYLELMRRYSRNPKGWSFTVSPARRHGFFDALVGGPDESWHLKLDTIFKPSPFALGARSGQGPSDGHPPKLSFGFRSLSPEVAPALLDDSAEGMARLLEFLGSVNPVAPTAPGSYIQGPYVYTSRGTQPSSLTREQQRVDEALSAEMLKLLRRRYPNYL